MKITFFLRIGVIAASLLTISAAMLPFAHPLVAADHQMAAMNQSASGKISAVSSDGFALDVKAGDASSTIQFTTDANTKIKGSLSVGFVANVEYETDKNGRNIATSVTVQTNG